MYGATKAADMLDVCETAIQRPLILSGRRELILAFIRGQGVYVVPIMKNTGTNNRLLEVSCSNVSETAVSRRQVLTATSFPSLSLTRPIRTPRSAEPANVKEPNMPIKKVRNP